MDVERLARSRPGVRQTLHAIDQPGDTIDLAGDQPGELDLLGPCLALEQLRRAADPRKRILDLVRQHRGGGGGGHAAAAALAVACAEIVRRAAVDQHDPPARPIGQRRDGDVGTMMAAHRHRHVDIIGGDRLVGRDRVHRMPGHLLDRAADHRAARQDQQRFRRRVAVRTMPAPSITSMAVGSAPSNSVAPGVSASPAPRRVKRIRRPPGIAMVR